MYALVNEGNIRTLTTELLEYLKAADAEFRPDLTAKICLLVQRFAPSKQWQFDSLLEVRAAFSATNTMSTHGALMGDSTFDVLTTGLTRSECDCARSASSQTLPSPESWLHLCMHALAGRQRLHARHAHYCLQLNHVLCRS